MIVESIMLLNEPIGVLKINEGLEVYFYKKMPNRFHRWMARVLLGWVYEDIKRSCGKENR